jgi:hypothetical protein
MPSSPIGMPGANTPWPYCSSSSSSSSKEVSTCPHHALGCLEQTRLGRTAAAAAKRTSVLTPGKHVSLMACYNVSNPHASCKSHFPEFRLDQKTEPPLLTLKPYHFPRHLSLTHLQDACHPWLVEGHPVINAVEPHPPLLILKPYLVSTALKPNPPAGRMSPMAR